MHVYHGTTKEHIQEILRNGFSEDRDLTWEPSLPGEICFYYNALGMDLDEGPSESFHWDELDWGNRRAALENAQITAALHHSADTSLYLIELDIDPDEISLYLDFSAPNMDGMALAIPVEGLNGQPFRVFRVPNAFIPNLGLAYLSASQIDGPGCRLMENFLSETEKTLLRQLSRNNTWSNLFLTLSEALDSALMQLEEIPVDPGSREDGIAA